jgi:hypothetical protein
MGSPHVYDKAKYHYESVEQHGLPEDHADNHTVVFLRWLIEHKLMSDFFTKESGGVLEKFSAGNATIHEVYEWWDCCLIDDMLSEEGNAFAMHYFEFENGRYIQDYITTLQGDLPTEFHVEYNESNYQRMREVMDRRYSEWKSNTHSRWWPWGSR